MGEVSYRPHFVWLYDLSPDQIMEIAQWIISCEMGHVHIATFSNTLGTTANSINYRYGFDRPEDAAFFKLKWSK